MTIMDERTRTSGAPGVAADAHAPTPRLDLSIGTAVAAYLDLATVLPGTAIHYAVKANPESALLRVLAQLGCRFDVASPAEVRAVLAAGARPEHLLHSNPISRRDHLAEAAALGVRQFVVDSVPEAAKVASVAPGTAVLVRLRTTGVGSDWPLSRKFGAPAELALEILAAAAGAGLDPAGVSFHVGSQQRDPRAWWAPVHTAADIFAAAEERGMRPWLLDLGGGFPGGHEGATPPLARYGETIEEALSSAFGSRRPQTLIEPGRGIVADAGVLVSRVVAVVQRDGRRWVHLDAGVFTGLVETLEDAIRYRFETSADGGELGPAVLAGPTCDSADVLYEREPVMLPLDLAEGDEVRFLAAGAYTTCYSTVGFNGFAPLPTRLVR